MDFFLVEKSAERKDRTRGKRKRERALSAYILPPFPPPLVSTFRGDLFRYHRKRKQVLSFLNVSRSIRRMAGTYYCAGQKNSLTLEILNRCTACSCPTFCFCEHKRAGAAYARNVVSHQERKDAWVKEPNNSPTTKVKESQVRTRDRQIG